MNIEQEIRAQIEKNRGLKLAVGEINNHLSVLEGLLRNERDDAQKEIDEAYQRGLEDGKGAIHKGCDGCKYEETIGMPPCVCCCNNFPNQWTANKQDEIEVGDEMRQVYESGAGTGVWCIVTAIDSDCMSGFSQDGRAIVCSSQVNRWWKKTGRHFDIEKILEEMKK